MNLDKLTILGCSTSMVLLLAANQPAEASLGPVSHSPVISPAGVTQIAQNAEAVNVDVDSDTVGDLAVEKFGCDCPPCRNQVMQLLQSGTLKLPE